ncbi:MAG: hypothetical protein J5780_03655, partial [Treponema sp.]|nr:hypothetical protein [Treponema sp.]
GSFKPASINFYSNITTGELNGHDIFNGWLMHGKFSGVLWGKLIKRTLFVKAFEYIPYTECSMGEDFLLTFYLSLNAEKYIGIKDKVYLYRITDGISSSRKIDSLQRWKMICSSSSIFSIVSTWLEENKNAVTDDELAAVKNRTARYLANCLIQMKEAVIPELKKEARSMLCEYWGRSFVERIEKVISGNRQFLQK